MKYLDLFVDQQRAAKDSAQSTLVGEENSPTKANRLRWKDVPHSKPTDPTKVLCAPSSLEPMEREAANERMLAGKPSENFSEGLGRALDKLAEAAGVSREFNCGAAYDPTIESTSEELPSLLQRFPGADFGSDGLWRWRGFIIVTSGSAPSYRKYFEKRVASKLLQRDEIKAIQGEVSEVKS